MGHLNKAPSARFAWLYLAFLVLCVPSFASSPENEVPPLNIAELGQCVLAGGEVLAPCNVAYRDWQLGSDDERPVLLVMTWHTGSTQDLATLRHIGPGGLGDTDRYRVIAFDALANGVSSSPSNHPPGAGAFPAITLGDMVQAQRRVLRDLLGLDRVHAVIGMSMGGMQALEWAVQYPGAMDFVVSIAGTPWPDGWDQLAWESLLALTNLDDGTEAGLGIANRAVAMQETQFLWTPERLASMLDNAEFSEFMNGMTPRADRGALNDRRAQLNAMLAHDIRRMAGGSVPATASLVKAQLLLVVASADHYVRPANSVAFADAANGLHWVIDSPCGHLFITFECEAQAVAKRVGQFLSTP